MSKLSDQTSVTVAEACQLTAWSERTLYRKIASGLIAIRRNEPEQGKQGPRIVILVASLPQAAQGKYWSRVLQAKWAAEDTGVEGQRGSGIEPVNLAEVPEATRARALRRQRIVEDALGLSAGGRRPRRAELVQLAAAHQIGVTTLYHWLAKYRGSTRREPLGRATSSPPGFPGLLDRHGQTKGRFHRLPPAAQDFLKDQFLTRWRPSPTTVYQRLLAFCDSAHLPAPSQTTVNRYLRTIPYSAVVLARDGPQAWRAACEPKCERDFSDLGVGAWWVSDHREFDVFVKMAWWDAVRRELREQFIRPWLTAWLDLRSRCCVGWQVHINPTSDTIACALRAGILRHGLPTHLYRDNGRDYTCHYWGGKSRTYKGVRLSDEAMELLRAGSFGHAPLQLHAALPYTPWSKPIESWFGHTFPEWEKTLPGWCGRDNKARPEKLDEEIASGQVLTLDEFIPRAAARIADYNATPHSALGGACPNELWDGITIERPAPRTLDLLLMRHQPVTVQAKGIKLFGRCYWHEDLHAYLKRRVSVKYDQNELGRLLVFDPATNRLICEALNQPAMRMGASHEDLKALHQRKRAAKQRVQQYLGDRHVLFNEEQVLAELAQRRRATTVVTLPSPDPSPAPGTKPVRRVVPAMDQAAARLSSPQAAAAIAKRAACRVQRAASRAGDAPGGTQDERIPPARPVPSQSTQDAIDATDEERERESIWAEINEAGRARRAAVARSKALDEADRDAIMDQLLHG